jgi:hypothetical protein
MQPFFFLTFEGLYVSCLNHIVYLLVCYGHDFYNPNIEKHRYADTAEKIAQADVELKFRFLEEHGFKCVVLRD